MALPIVDGLRKDGSYSCHSLLAVAVYWIGPPWRGPAPCLHNFVMAFTGRRFRT
jgi:hypothetical protein